MARRKSYTAAYMLDAVKFSLLHGIAAAARQFEVDSSLIRRWKREEENLHMMPATKRAPRFEKPKVAEVEEVLYQWITQKRASNRAVLVKDIREEALRLAEEFGETDFRASASWCQKFMHRRKLTVRRRTSVGQSLPNDHLEKFTNFRKFVVQESLHISLYNIGNVDEVPVPFDMVYGRTVEKVGLDAVKIDSTGHEKSNFTVALSVTAAGEKLRPLIIFKKKLVPKEDFPPEVVVKANAKGWMNQDIMEMWLDEVWNRREHYNSAPSQSLLILDSAKCHLTESLRPRYKESSKVAIISGGLTGHLQPLDIGINKPFKDNMMQGWEQWMSNTANASYTKSGHRKKLTYSEVATLVRDSFYWISTDTIVNSFRKASDVDSRRN